MIARMLFLILGLVGISWGIVSFLVWDTRPEAWGIVGRMGFAALLFLNLITVAAGYAKAKAKWEES